MFSFSLLSQALNNVNLLKQARTDLSSATGVPLKATLRSLSAAVSCKWPTLHPRHICTIKPRAKRNHMHTRAMGAKTHSATQNGAAVQYHNIGRCARQQLANRCARSMLPAAAVVAMHAPGQALVAAAGVRCAMRSTGCNTKEHPTHTDTLSHCNQQDLLDRASSSCCYTLSTPCATAAATTIVSNLLLAAFASPLQPLPLLTCMASANCKCATAAAVFSCCGARAVTGPSSGR